MAKVFMVEDHEPTAEVLAEILTLEGYDLEIACRGDDAVERAPAMRPDVILLDFGLPILDGGEVAAALRLNPITACIPLILMTASSRVQERAALMGTVHFLAKPFELADLLACVERALASLL